MHKRKLQMLLRVGGEGGDGLYNYKGNIGYKKKLEK